MKTIDLNADTIDIRDIIERIEELEGMEGQELEALTAIMEELKGNGGDEQWRGDWYPLTLISEDSFTDHIEQLIDDCYEIQKSSEWPYRHLTLDVEAAAEEAKQDYSEIEIDGVTYLYR